ncbi:hypothetical protein C1645_841072 [Glomus cerebriforme]|uniref:TRP C-terminal domain-containing protein n=1 Tax=Glomus cerebriforme TaxID=658196 RepID=A0A397SAD2_9GLOM|nr:hypothetical protein C1645_841072 [Glomus cerebriforme]
MRNARPFWLVSITTILLVFQVGLTLSQDTPGTQGTIFPPTLFKSSFQDLLILNGTNYFIVEAYASDMIYNYNVINGNPENLISYVTDRKNFEAHPCYDVENCDFSVVSCSPTTNKCERTLAGSLYLTQPDVIIWFLFSLDFTEPIEMKVSVRVNNTITLPTPTILSPHPADSPPLNGDLTSDGYANCGTMEFDDFRVGYSKEENNIEFYARGTSESNFIDQVQIIVYFDAIHIVKNSFPIQVNVGPFIITQKFQTGFNDRFPDALFNAPGTGAYAILKFQDINVGCATAPVGSEKTAYSTTITGFSMALALACLPLSASLFFLSKEVNYSIYPEKWLNANSNTGDVDIAENSGAVINKSSFTKTPSIYDLISVAQWIITTALLTLPNLPAGYRQFASNFGWSTGTGGGINVQAFSNAADNLRRLVCLLPSVCASSSSEFDTCRPWFNSDVTPEYLFTANLTNGDRTYFADPTGFDSYSNTLHIPNSNIFFVMFVSFLLAISSALIITLLIGTVASKLKEKWTIMRKASENIRLIVCAAILRVVLSTFRIDENILWNDEYKIVYGVLYTDYLKNRVWFFIPLMIFQTFRSLVVAFGLHSGAAQLTGLILLEIVHFTVVYRYKPYERYLANILNMILSSGRLLVLFLLIPFLGGHVTITPATRYSLAVVLIVIQIVMAASVGGLIILNMTCTIFKFVKRKLKKDINNEENIDQNQERPVDDDSSIKE